MTDLKLFRQPAHYAEARLSRVLSTDAPARESDTGTATSASTDPHPAAA